MHMERDPSLDTLLALDGEVLVIDPAGRCWVRFRVKRVPPTPDRPHGLVYSLTLDAANGERLVGYDNAHPVPGRAAQRNATRDHRHRLRTVRAYDYSDAATLLADFWSDVDAVLKERGLLP